MLARFHPFKNLLWVAFEAAFLSFMTQASEAYPPEHAIQMRPGSPEFALSD